MTVLVSLAGSMPPTISSVPLSFSEHLWTLHLASTAGYTLLVFDYFLTLNQEIKYIWKAKWTLSKVLYLFNRYGLLSVQTFILMEHTGMFYQSDNTQFCSTYTIVGILSNFLTTETVHLSVLLRAWTVWGCKRKVVVVLVSLYVAYTVWNMTILLQSTRTPSWDSFVYYGIIGICIKFLDDKAYTSWIGSLIIDTFFFLCTWFSLLRYERVCPYPTRLRRHLKVSAVLFYVVCMFSDIFSIVTWKYWGPMERSDPRWFLSITLVGPMASIAAQRLILSLRSLQGQSLGLRSMDLSAEVRRQLAEFESDDEEGDGHYDNARGHVRIAELDDIELASETSRGILARINSIEVIAVDK